METNKHPYSKVIHYATGGIIDNKNKTAKFTTLCGRTFSQGHSDIMQSGYAGVKNVTCKICKKRLKKQH